MKLTQHSTFKNFYEVKDSGFFVFSRDTTNTEFDLEQAFTSYTFDFFLVFYKNYELRITSGLNSKISAGDLARRICWLDDTENISDFNSCPFFAIKDKNVVYGMANTNFGSHLNWVAIMDNGNKSTVSFKKKEGVLQFDVIGSKTNSLKSVQGEVTLINKFNQFIIPLKGQEQLFGLTPADGANTGFICFRSLPSTGSSIQPASTLLTEANSEVAEHSFRLFEDTSYSKNTELLGSFYPALDFANSHKNFVPRLEVFFKGEINSNILDEFGNNFIVSSTEFKPLLINELACTNSDKDDKYDTRNFCFIPKHLSKLELESKGQQMLLGNSGSERQSKTNLVFYNVEEVLYKELESGQIEVKAHGRSRTSLALSPDKEEKTYFVDSERFPSFKNKAISDYEAIDVGVIKNDVAEKRIFPIIPILCFSENNKLEELENVLVKHRLTNSKKIDAASRVTPNGFLKSGSQFDFINNKKQNLKASFDNASTNVEVNYRFTINLNNADVKANLDFNTSITKEDVFFVTTPKLLKETADFHKHFDIFFGMHGFDVDLILGSSSSFEHKDRIIVFKYSRYSVEELMEDTSKWSNFGKFKRDFPALQSALRNEFQNFELEYNSGGNPDYQYIDQVVRRDRNWNGIFILNIPISNSEYLPDIFTGLISSQSLKPYDIPQNPDNENKRQFKVGLKFQYVAFPVNKTEIGSNNAIQIKSTSFYGLIDYDLLKKRRDGDLTDITTVKAFFPKNVVEQKNYRFLLTKLLVRFENSEIRHFQSFAFLQTPSLFEDRVKFDGTTVTHDDSNPDPVKNLIRLEGNYQKNSGGGDEFSFTAKSEITYIFPPEKILKDITLKSLSFHFSGGKNYRFNIDAEVHFNKFGLEDIFSISKINFRNIGLSFKISDLSITFPSFDLSSLGVFPDIDFDGKGFLSSFPIKFNSFKTFEIPKISLPGGGFELGFPKHDFFNLMKPKLPQVTADWLNDVNIKFAPLFSFIFDFDLGTLGNLGGLKGIKAQFMVGWSFNGGFALGLKIGGASIEKLRLDLFGALKIDISKLELCKIKEQYVIRILDLRLEALGIKLPLKEKEVMNGLIFANTKPGKDKKTGWLITYISHLYGEIDNPLNPLLLGIGQRVTIKDIEKLHLVEEAILKVKQIFNAKTELCGTNTNTIPDVYNPKNNWLIASERFIPKAWRSIFDVKFIFNDPTLYALQVHLIKYFKIDILYKKISDELGVYSTELELAPSLRNIDLGGAALTLPNIGLDAYTNGDFMIDVGYPRSSDDWSRSILLQVRPFLGFAGIKGGRLRTASLSLFDPYKDQLPPGCNIIQGGIALRVGLGAYIDKGIFYAGASVTVYGILDGALAFNPGEQGIARVFPDHFALFGRIGAMVEIVGAVDFKIVKASVHVILRVEFGVLLAVINGKLQPVPVYIEGEVKVSITFTIACFRVFGSRVCITIRLSFRAYVRFPYTFGDDSSKRWALDPGFTTNFLNTAVVEFGEIPVLYVPGVTKTADGNKLVHQFVINFFASNVVKDGDNFKPELPKFNILKDSIVKPIFEAIYIAADKPVTLPYSFLREMFIEGKNAVPPPFKLDFSKYKPTILAGYKWDVDADREFLKSIFLLSDAEVTTFTTLINSAPCKPGDSEKCPFRPIPVPINSSLKVKEKGKAPFETTNKGFTIKITDLFKNPDGTETVEKIIEEAEPNSENAYSSDDLEAIESYFDSYVTQYLDRKSPAALEAPPKDLDVRRDAIIPEYFKLIGMLFLESCYNEFLNQADKSDPKTIDPLVSFEYFTDAGSEKKDFVVVFSNSDGKAPVKIKPNDVLPDLVGQLNYFYNNGLRLPDVLKNPNSTKAYFDLIGQTSDLKNGAITASAAADIKIIKRDNSASVSLKNELFSGDGLDQFVGTANKILGASTVDLKNQILSVKSEDPYEFVNVKLGILSSLVGTKDKGHRFFEVPDRIHRNLGGITNRNEQYKKLVFNLRSEGETKADVDYAACINVQVKVKPHFQSDNKCRVLELVNVNVDDLELMHKIKSLTDYAFIDKISLYLKSDNDLIPLKLSEEAKKQPSLAKTNLSPKTHPPVIDISRASFAGDAEKHIAMMNNFPDFSRILWEAVTTNHGGFYLVESKDADVFSANFKKPSSPDEPQEYTIVFSFESKADQPVFAFSNYFKVHKDSLNFELLDKGKIRLYTKVNYDKVIGTDKEGKPIYQPVQEYHSKIPAHCFSFNVKRKPPKANSGLEQYIPLEFGITKKDGTPIMDEGGKAILTRDKILPLMPKNELDEKGNPIDSEWNYNHVSPMSAQTEKNLDRYALVGESFKVNFSIRDAFGFRIIESDKSLSHTQKYFDKLIPLNSWPCITLNYWFDKYLSDDDLQFNLSLKLFENKDLSKFKDSETVDPLDSVKKSLYTILAQLKDKRMHAEIVCKGNQPVNIKKELTEAVETVISNLDKPDEITAEVLKPKLIPFSVKTGNQFKCELNPQIVLERRALNDQDDVFMPIDKNIWDSDLVHKTVGSITLLVPKTGSAEQHQPDAPQENAVQVLNKLVSVGKYKVGISVKDDHRIIYLVNSEHLTMSLVETSPLSRRDSYFAVKPYSNKLWSGSYKPQVDGLTKKSYTGIDLDKGLNIILSKVDELLSPDKIKELIVKNNPEGLNYAELLVHSKKLLVENELKGKTANIDDPKSTVPELTKEFRSLILERLDNFYKYDGIINLTLPYKTELEDQRLFVSVKKVNEDPSSLEKGVDYNLTSSKIHFKDGRPGKWFIMFDQIGIDQWINLKIKPLVTHIEFDIEEMGSEIQKSTWIKLIEPIGLLPGGKTISTIHPDTDETKKWPRVFREFPVKPSVLLHEAKQPDGFNPSEVSSIEELGNWEYALTLKGDFKPETDRLDFKIKIKEFPAPSVLFGESEERTFSGFIAYWSEMMSKPGFNADLFIDDLYKVLNPVLAFENITPPTYKYYAFITEASKQGGKFVWNIKKDEREQDNFPKFQISIEQNADLLNLKFSQKGFNIFKAEPEKICSVLPEVIQKRNFRAKNDDFVYTTDMISPATWATPHIKFFDPIRINGEKPFMEIFKTLKGMQLPYKSTSKLLVNSSENLIAATAKLPVITITQMEFTTGSYPGIPEFDDVFKPYKNGNPALSVTVYNESHGANEENDLPIFFANSIYKKNNKNK